MPVDFKASKKDQILEVFGRMEEIASKYQELRGKTKAASEETSEFVGFDVMKDESSSEFQGLGYLEREILVQQWTLAER